MLSQSSVTSSSTQGRARPVGGEADQKTVQWTVFPPNALRHLQGRENGRCPEQRFRAVLVADDVDAKTVCCKGGVHPANYRHIARVNTTRAT